MGTRRALSKEWRPPTTISISATKTQKPRKSSHSRYYDNPRQAEKVEYERSRDDAQNLQTEMENLHHIETNRARPQEVSCSIRPVQTKREPRDEQLRIPGPAQRVRPMPINLPPGDHLHCLQPSIVSQRPSTEIYDSPLDPEIIDFAGSNTTTWPQSGRLRRAQFSRRRYSPSVASQYTQQSEMSYGILDYYINDDHSPLPSPGLPPSTPRIDTPVIDPGLDKFEFDLAPPKSPSPFLLVQDEDTSRPFQSVRATPDTGSGAEQEADTTFDLATPSRPMRPSTDRKNTYSLFPTIREVSTPSRSSSTDAGTLRNDTPTSSVTLVPSHQNQPPEASYRPRKESMSSSVQSRKDSFTSFSGTCRIPMRIISSGSTDSTSKTRSKASMSISASSPPDVLLQSRWSDDTITSPVVITTPGPRVSFGPLLDRGSTSYPACFFEDDDDEDDESAPLRRKFSWKRSLSWAREPKEMQADGHFDERHNFRRRFTKVVLCGCC